MLKDEIDEAKRAVSTDSVQITIGEVANMYTSAELDILPDFQRLFRWSDNRKSNFVESILIGIPIPPGVRFREREWRMGTDRWAPEDIDRAGVYGNFEGSGQR